MQLYAKQNRSECNKERFSLFVCCLSLTDKGNFDSVKLTGSEIGKQAAAKSKGLFSAEDWMCSKCVLIDFDYSELLS